MNFDGRYLAPISGQIERMMSFTGNSEFGTRQNILQAFPSLCEPVPVSSVRHRNKIFLCIFPLLDLRSQQHGRGFPWSQRLSLLSH